MPNSTNKAKRVQSPPLEVRLLREGIGESAHRVQATVCDDRGRLLSLAGNADASTFARSTLKPFQALSLLATDALDSYCLGDRDLAIACASHNGAIAQARQAFNILWRADIDPSELQCSTPPGKQSPLQHNCSGKHAAMLAACQYCGWPLGTYLRPQSNVQQFILRKVAELLRLPAAELLGVRDDCGVPTYCLQLSQLATLYAHLSAGDNLYLERMARAMVHHPDAIAGEGEFDTELMRLSGGELVSKAGAEGVQCVGRLGEGMGLAVKATDGAKRAKTAATVHLLKQMGWLSPDAAEALAERFQLLGEHKRLEVAGELSLL
ncbi:MAG: asparaginase [Cyanobacteria bacterium QS_8_64_29]|nr:MAG: asparaginase [Cyanobacteria bacterium QS_8_64_29]